MLILITLCCLTLAFLVVGSTLLALGIGIDDELEKAGVVLSLLGLLGAVILGFFLF